jgi:hypothetical protein
VNNYQIILYILYWHKCQCWQVVQHECKFRICSIRCLESCRLDIPINCLRKMEKATSSVNTLTAAFSKSCLVTVFISLTLFCRGALLSWRSFVAALFCRCAHIAALFCRALICRALICRALKCRRFQWYEDLKRNVNTKNSDFF